MPMETGYPFLERLGLDETADARAIRRAYARELKLVDQQRDPDAFQDLRECYETALSWAAWDARRRAQAEAEAAGDAAGSGVAAEAAAVPEAAQAAQDAQPPAQVMSAPVPAGEPDAAADAAMVSDAQAGVADAPAPPVPDRQAPWDVGRALFHAFCAGLPGLEQRRLEPREQPWTDALRVALADERLLNFETRLSFEVHLAHLLADGWRSGHEFLFPACAQVFGWDSDRRALGRLGQAGQVLDLALEERASFFAQDVQQRTGQRNVLALLRQPEPPSDQRLAEGMGGLEQMMQRFPHWLPLIAPAAGIAAWRERYRQRHGRPFSLDDMPASAPAPAPRTRWGNAWVAWACVMGLVGSLRLYGGSGDGGSAAYRPAPSEAGRVVERLRREEAQDASRLGSADGGQAIERLRRGQVPGAAGPASAGAGPVAERRPAAQARPLTQAQLDEIGRRIDYKPGPDAKTGPVKVRFQVRLDGKGKVDDVRREEAIGDPAFAAAAEKAVRSAGPFAPATSKAFQLTYSGTIRKVRRPAPAPVPSPESAPNPPEAAPEAAPEVLADPQAR